MLTLFLVFIITTLYEGNTIGRGAVRGGDTAQDRISTDACWLAQAGPVLYSMKPELKPDETLKNPSPNKFK